MSVKQRDTVRQSGARFVMIEHDIFDACQLKPTTFAVYCGLMMYANEDGYCFPSRGKLATRVGVSVSTVRSAITELEDVGLVTRSPRFDDTGEQTSNEYTVFRPSDTNRPGPAPDGGEGVIITDRGLNSAPRGEQILPTPRLNSAHLNKNQLTKPNSELEDSDTSQSDDRQLSPSEDESQGSGPGTELPYPMVDAVFAVQGGSANLLQGQQLGRQLAVAKRLIKDGVTIDESRKCAEWLLGQGWVKSVDMFLITKKLADYRLALSRASTGKSSDGVTPRGLTAKEALGKYYKGDD